MRFEKQLELTTTEVVGFIQQFDYVSMTELLRRFEGARGDLEMYHSDRYPNIVLYSGISKDLLTVINSGLDQKLIHWVSCSPFVYLIDGGGLTLPIAKSLRSYKSLRWLPICFRPGASPK